MKKYKPQYLIPIALIIIMFFAELCFDFLNDDKVNLLIAFTALIIAVISMAISDPKTEHLKVQLQIWNRNKPYVFNGGKDKAESFAFEIINLGKNQLEGFNVSFRFQKKLYHRPHPANDSNTYFEFGNRLIVQNNMLKYLGITKEDNNVRFEHMLKELTDWKMGKLSITVAASGYIPHTFLIDHTEKDELLATNNKNRKYLRNRK
tara:strand:+ start:27 stop:641 length:615 start_codon:yes stop_codon:yes gene_type:complete